MKPTWCLPFVAYVIIALLAWKLSVSHAGETSQYIRKLWASQDMPVDNDAFRVPEGFNAPQQVHITQGDYDGQAMIVSWVTPFENASNVVSYGLASGNFQHVSMEANVTTYKFANYTSGFIHHCLIQGLMHDANYTYKIGPATHAREFWFVTPPKPGRDVAHTFGVIGDLGQTYDSRRTLEHYKKSNGQTVLYVGDLSYADTYPFDNGVRWDTWGRFVEPSTAYQPWIWTAGNHEIEFKPQLGEIIPFKPFLHRYSTPYLASKSTSPLWYAIRRASAHIIVLSSYSAYGKYTPQWAWLQDELKRVNRKVTPWLIVLMHAPLYNSNTAHYMEGEGMRAVLETSFLKYKVDIVFAGHVHAYERSHRVSNVASNILNGARIPVQDKSAPVYITVGDGGNIEGLAGIYTEPQPDYSAFREASFGHARLEIKNCSHAYFLWHRNDDGEESIADAYWLHNQYWVQSPFQDVNPRRKLEKSKHFHGSAVNEQLVLL